MDQVLALEHTEVGSFAPEASPPCPRRHLNVVSWNINRGCCFERILEFLGSVDADLILLQECDRNALRSNGRHIAREIAQQLEMDYVFGIEFLELSQGMGDVPAHHGQATLSRRHLFNPRVLRFIQQSSFWRPRWFLPNIRPLQRRVGGRMVLVCETTLNQTTIATYNLHLESRSSEKLRYSQLCEVLHDAQRYGPNAHVVIAGDFNFELTQRRASAAIQNAGFRNPFASKQIGSTMRKGSLGRPRAIDWILIGGSHVSGTPYLHGSVSGSDHYPLSLTLSF